MTSAILARKPTLLRIGPSTLARGTPDVVRNGGDFGAGLIRKATIVTAGEAIGHDLWIDATMLAQVAEAINASRDGIKSHFTHPSLSGDGLGKGLGRYRNASVEDGHVRSDLHIFEAAHSAPDGDLAGYVMTLATEDSRAFANSIAFVGDDEAQDEYMREHSDGGEFRSPDKNNKQNFPHARLARLRAVDVVDDPAANPEGLFHRGQEIAMEADGLLSYALGLSDQRPTVIELDVDPDRVAGFVKRFLSSHDLEIGPCGRKEAIMADPDQVTTTPSGDDAEALRTEGQKNERTRFEELNKFFKDKPEFVNEMFAAGHDLEKAKVEFSLRETARLQEENEVLKAKIEELQATNDRLATNACSKEGGTAVAFSIGREGADSEDFNSIAKARAKELGVPLHEAMSDLSEERPELWAKQRLSKTG